MLLTHGAVSAFARPARDWDKERFFERESRGKLVVITSQRSAGNRVRLSIRVQQNRLAVVTMS